MSDKEAELIRRMIENNKKYTSAPEEHKEQARKDRDKEAFTINKDRGNLK